MNTDLLSLVEIGSRGVRLLIARLADGELRSVARRYDSEASLTEALRLSGGALTAGVEAVRQVVESYVRESLQTHAVPLRRIWVFGTEAVRRLRDTSPTAYGLLTRGFNVVAAFERASDRSPTALDFVVLKEKDEAYYSLAAAIRSLPDLIKKGDLVLAIDQGSGSVELALGRSKDSHIRCESHRAYPLGTSALASQLRGFRGDHNELRSWLMEKLQRALLPRARSATRTVILGSAVTMLARVILKRSGKKTTAVKYSPREVHGYPLTIEDVEQHIRDHWWKQQLTPVEIKAGEFEIVLAGLVALHSLLSIYHKREFVVCAEALRYGVAWELAVGCAERERVRRR